jgi:ABC-type histidine transport system ATPase subunit
MEQRELYPSRRAGGDQVRLAIAQNLARLYREVLEEPLPPQLCTLIESLEKRLQAR